MQRTETISGVLLSSNMDLKSFYGLETSGRDADVRLFEPEEVSDPDAIRFAVCWLPDTDAFAPYPNLQMAMSIGAGVDALLGHPGLDETAMVCRVRDPHQAELMAGYTAHEVLHVLRDFAALKESQDRQDWAPLPMAPPRDTTIAVLGNGTMGKSVTRALAALGFTVRVACRTIPDDPLAGVGYVAGADAVLRAAEGANIVVNVLPLTQATENILNARLFGRLAEGSWLVQIGRGEHLHEMDFMAALDSGRLAGASLDVFRQEPLPADHPFWNDKRLRITPHIASDSTPSIVREQVLTSAKELLGGSVPSLAIDRRRGY
ncbi:NAD(P)-dependent oxidoreductase [Roseibium sp. Sym1]|uniref:NAD(P)-dependent oxidoreductase n=1 Tax=Roseibium sp. Sym1 TaxID=3016006 RepID=UPI0022B56BF3|nr:NAD(P)-dependent oxidoreductase [Roseibium sp. Sym1]